jgi:tetratricopeptide (TPR) repeat protein
LAAFFHRPAAARPGGKLLRGKDMTREHNSSDTPVQQSLAELLAQYLERQAAAHGDGLGTSEVGDVVPFEAVPAQPVDPRLAWDEALAAARSLLPDCDTHSWRAPAEWPALVAGREPMAALAFCLGNFPQLVRDLHALLHTSDPKALRQSAANPVSVPLMSELAERAVRHGKPGEALLGAGAMRLAGQFDQAAELLERLRTDLPANWSAAWVNEEAALAWHRGRAEDAARLWHKQAASVPVLFNRGMAALFLGKRADARPALRQAAERLPEDGAWHHLARLYLALAEMRG